MTDVTEPTDGDSELAAPLDARARRNDARRSNGDDAVVTKGGRPSNSIIVLGAILVIVVAQLVVTMLLLSANTQLRDQYTSANGLQRCLIRAQLNENQTTDPSGAAYKAAVTNCLK
jgi:hypothetical protein